MKKHQPKSERIELKSMDANFKKHHNGVLFLKPGQNIWFYNMETGEKGTIDIVNTNNFTWATRNNEPIKRLRTKNDCLYVVAGSEEEAVKRILKKFGWEFNEKTGQAIANFPVVKGEDQFIEINKPAGPETEEAKVIEITNGEKEEK